MNLLCLLDHTKNSPFTHVVIAGAALRQLDKGPAQRVWARWKLFTYTWSVT